MEIEIITTKKKLGKSVVKQLSPASLGDINHFISMKTNGYYIRDLGSKFSERVALFHGINEWVIMDIRDWRSCGELRVEAEVESGHGVSVKTFQSKEVRDMWIDAYSKAKELCLKNHLIL